ncbi:MAG: S1C family serine protease [Verrucomicrobiae bacterium]|nr:S1C family serine protease [Verrucomicrobiae bacterium]NNJ87597.1 serine protease [Akkermansiaceae bacterium]
MKIITLPTKLFACMAVASLSLTTPGLHAAPKIKDIQQLKSLQAQVEGVVKNVLPATVSLFSAKSGASGSGVIVSKEGLILTAGHVVRGAEEMTIIFPNGKQARGEVLGANYTRDSAMIQILDKMPDGGWPYAEVGKSKGLSTGDLVLALGHAGGYDPVRTPPVRFGRLIARGPNKFITTDCTLIGGDSGGPLFDLQGRVVGIHSSIGSSLSSNNHASIEGFHQDWKKLVKGDTWGRLGGSSLLDNPDAPVLGVMTGESARGGIGIRHVFEGGPAGKAGLRAGDIIRSINGRAIPNLRILHASIAEHKPGDTIKIRVTRGEDSLIRDVKLGRRGDIIPDNRP